MESVERLRQELDDVAQGRFDIVIGTQLVAKGHHFPKLNLVGIVDADLGLATAIRAPPSAPSSCCIRWSAAPGARQGRGIGYLQTHQPEHPVMRALIAQDREAFYAAEIAAAREGAAIRRSAGWRACSSRAATSTPPSSLRASSRRVAPRDDRCACSGPAEAPLAVVRGRYRFRLLVKAPRGFDLSAYLREWLAAAPKTKGTLKLEVDVDPQSFF